MLRQPAVAKGGRERLQEGKTRRDSQDALSAPGGHRLGNLRKFADRLFRLADRFRRADRQPMPFEHEAMEPARRDCTIEIDIEIEGALRRVVEKSGTKDDSAGIDDRVRQTLAIARQPPVLAQTEIPLATMAGRV